MSDPLRRVVLPPYVPFWQRVFLLSVKPTYWLHAAVRTIGAVLVSLLVLAFVTNLALGIYRGIEFRAFLIEGAEAWDRNYDPVVFENGRVRVLGDRIVRFQDGKQTFLVDPAETVSLRSIRTPKFFVVRSTEIVRKDTLRGMQRISLSDMEEMLGSGPIIFDTAHLQEYIGRYVIWIQIAVALLFAFLVPVFDLIGCLLYALPAAGLVLLLKGRAAGLTFGSAFRVCLAASSATLVIDLFLSLVGASPPAVLGAPLWIVLIFGFALAATFQLESQPATGNEAYDELPPPELGDPSASPPYPG
jgi:hypothetical protein